MTTLLAAMLCVGFAASPIPAKSDAPLRRPLSPTAQVIRQIRDETRAGCVNALTADHRAKTLAIIAQFNAGNLAYEVAASAIGKMLNADEIYAIQTQELSLIAMLHAQVHPGRPASAVVATPSFRLAFTGQEAGVFLVRMLGDSGKVHLQATTAIPMPGSSPH